MISQTNCCFSSQLVPNLLMVVTKSVPTPQFEAHSITFSAHSTLFLEVISDDTHLVCNLKNFYQSRGYILLMKKCVCHWFENSFYSKDMFCLFDSVAGVTVVTLVVLQLQPPHSIGGCPMLPSHSTHFSENIL